MSEAQFVDVETAVAWLVGYGVERGLISREEQTYSANLLFDVLRFEPDSLFDVEKRETPESSLEEALAFLLDDAVRRGVIEDGIASRDLFDTRLMGCITPRPGQVIPTFWQLYEDGPEKATDYFYKLALDSDYIRSYRIARDRKWVTNTRYGDLDITINLSKPEKDPRDIARAGAAPTGDIYPACQLCIENEAYSGRAASAAGGAHPARQNLRIVPIELEGERWGFQYSPYAYFNEHCIAMSAEHRPMHVDEKSMGCLLDLVTMFPHYFFGSNADLPIVGGSILSHDHFQGGRHVFPMTMAKEVEKVVLPGFTDVDGAIVEWPLSVVRLTSESRDSLLAAATHVLDLWRDWDDETVGVVSHDADGTRHNTITPIARRVGEAYQLDLALRCNVTSPENPLGVFHPHAQWHHVKKENIGLIEVMGLAILPPRLVPELAAVRGHLLDGTSLEDDPLSASHAAWARELAARHPELDEKNADSILRDEVGAVFGHVLEDAGVFKWDDAGREAMGRFVSAL